MRNKYVYDGELTNGQIIFLLVILNGANMSRIAPPHSYINVQVSKLKDPF